MYNPDVTIGMGTDDDTWETRMAPLKKLVENEDWKVLEKFLDFALVINPERRATIRAVLNMIPSSWVRVGPPKSTEVPEASTSPPEDVHEEQVLNPTADAQKPSPEA